MNFDKIKENFKTIGDALIDSGKEIVKGLKEDLKPKTAEERLKEAKERIASDPNLTKEDILQILEDSDNVDTLKRKINEGCIKLMELYRDAPGEARKIKIKIQTLLNQENREKLLETLKLEESLIKAKEIAERGSEKAIKRIKHILNSFVDDID